MRTLNIISILLCMCTAIQAQTKQPTFSGKVFQNGPARLDTIIFSYRLSYASPADGLKNVDAITDSLGNFNVQLPRFDQPVVLAIRPRINRKVGFLYNFFYMEPTDSIFINIYKNTEGKMDSATFSGIGAGKYNLISRLSSAAPPEIRKKIITLTVPENLEGYLSGLEQRVKEVKDYNEGLVKTAKLDNQIAKMITYDFANPYTNWLLAIRSLYTISYKDKSPEREELKRHFNTFKGKFQDPEDPAMALVPAYLDNIALRENLDLLINNPGDTIPLKALYEVFNTKYHGYVRERLLANFFLAGKGRSAEVRFDDQTYDSLFKAANKLITLPILKKAMDHQARTLQGRELFNATFTDLQGNPFDTSTLNGKVIFIDLWGVGCTWCALFHQDFHKDFYPLLKDNPDFVYLAIGTSKEPKHWKNGITSGKYTSTDYLNVYTSGQALQHPFTRYYNIQGVPFLLLIGKDGNIVSGNIAEPKEAYKLIRQALQLPQQSK